MKTQKQTIKFIEEQIEEILDFVKTRITHDNSIEVSEEDMEIFTNETDIRVPDDFDWEDRENHNYDMGCIYTYKRILEFIQDKLKSI